MKPVSISWLVWQVCSLSIVLHVPTARTSTFTDSIYSVNITRGDNRGENLTDRVNLAALNSTPCRNQDELRTELGARCETVREQSGLCYLACSCVDDRPSFVLWNKQCVDERRFRQGCYFVFGSWAWSTGWSWNSPSDPLQVLYIEGGFGLASAFNASTQTFSQCTLIAIQIYSELGEWKSLTGTADQLIVTFYKFRRRWHLSWIIEDLSTGKADEIEGRFMRLNIKCSSANSVNGSVESVEQSSCLAFKVSGNLTHQYDVITTVMTSSPMNPTATSAYQKSTAQDHISATIAQTSSLVAQTSSPKIETTNKTPKTNTLARIASTSAPYITRATSRAISPMIAITSDALHTRTPVLPTGRSMVQTSTPVVQTGALITQASSPTFPTTTMFHTASVLSSRTPHTLGGSSASLNPTNWTPEQSGTSQMEVIIGAVVGGAAFLAIITAIIVLSFSTFKVKRVSTSSEIPMRRYHNKGAIAPESV